jgi:SAM-dependent methyltransferase
MATRARFDRQYYQRFYGSSRERSAYGRDEQRLAAFVFAYLNYLGQPVSSVADLGCGLGIWRDIVKARYPDARYTGVERSDYLCREYGWTKGSVVDFSSPEPYDLVICKDTLQYLPAADFRAAVRNLSALCRGALYLSILTREDWRDNCDRERTDNRVFLRSAAWYREILESHFINLGGGMFLSEASPAIPWELETAGRPGPRTGQSPG